MYLLLDVTGEGGYNVTVTIYPSPRRVRSPATHGDGVLTPSSKFMVRTSSRHRECLLRHAHTDYDAAPIRHN